VGKRWVCAVVRRRRWWWSSPVVEEKPREVRLWSLEKCGERERER
jgi:hypothetical protein